MSKITIILCRGRSDDSPRRRFEQDLAAALAARPDAEVAVLPHLYDLTPEGPGMQRLQSVAGDMLVLGELFPRASHWVLDANEVKGRIGPTPQLPEDEIDEAAAGASGAADDYGDAFNRTIRCLDLRRYGEVADVLHDVEPLLAPTSAETTDAASAENATAPPIEEDTEFRWYPVIDYSRCVNCLECLNFCLFGVYGMDDADRLIVEQPDACRDGCPACSRVCPSQAIMFPHHNSPAIAGDHTAPSDGFNLDLVQLFETASPIDLAAVDLAAIDLAAAERAKALAVRAFSSPKTGEPSKPGNEPTGETTIETAPKAASKSKADDDEKPPTARADPAYRDDLDKLVDELDRLDL